MRNRRDFLKTGTMVAASALAPGAASAQGTPARPSRARGAKMVLTYKPYTLSLKHVFTLATSSRTTTPCVLTQVAYDGVIGYGESSMPTYLGETKETCQAFLATVNLGK